MARELRPRGAILLSDYVGWIEVECVSCDRRGRYRADRLIAQFGDLSLPTVLPMIAARGGCGKAKNPPEVSDISNYQARACQIKIIM